MFRNRKVYGCSQVTRCPFCEKQATTKNKQNIPVCKDHRDSELENIFCICRAPLELRDGKFGPYFFCPNCGNINFQKGLEYRNESKNTGYKINKKYRRSECGHGRSFSSEPKTENRPEKQVKKETVVTSDELDFMY